MCLRQRIRDPLIRDAGQDQCHVNASLRCKLSLAKCRQVTTQTLHKEKWTLKLTGYLMKAVAPLL